MLSLSLVPLLFWSEMETWVAHMLLRTLRLMMSNCIRNNLSMLVLCCALICGCAASAVEKDLVSYINQNMMGMIEVEKAALTRYAEVSGEKYKSDQVLYDVLKSEVVPTYTDFVRVLNQIEPQTDAVKQLHSKFINGSVCRLRGFQTILCAIQTQDADLIRAANNLLTAGARDIATWQTDLEKMYETFEIKQIRK